MKLISMTDFVLEQSNEAYSKDQFIERVEAYANFLKEPLKLEMFIGENSIFIFQWEFKEWAESDMEC